MKVYWLERDAIAIADTSDLRTFTSVTEAKTVTMFTIKEDEPFVADDTSSTGIGMTESSNIQDEFHEALAYRVIQQGYERKPESIQLAGYFKAQFEEAISEAKKSSNKGYDNSSYSIQGYSY
jgi:hypothetical protein